MTGTAARLRELYRLREERPYSEEATAAAMELIEALDALAEAQPDPYLAPLASAWLEYGSDLAIKEESPDAALEPLANAVDLFRWLAETAAAAAPGSEQHAIAMARLAQAQEKLADQYLAAADEASARPLLRRARRHLGLASDLLKKLSKQAPERLLGEYAYVEYLIGNFHLGRAQLIRAQMAYENAADAYATVVRVQPECRAAYLITVHNLVDTLVQNGDPGAARNVCRQHGVPEDVVSVADESAIEREHKLARRYHRYEWMTSPERSGENPGRVQQSNP